VEIAMGILPKAGAALDVWKSIAPN